MSARIQDRYPYSSIPARPVYDWPGGKRLAIYVALNLEWFSFGEGLGAELAPDGPQPDVLNYAWRDYGNRVGVFRLAALFDELKLPGLAVGRSNSEREGDLTEYQERLLIEDTTAAIEKHSGKRPHGWLGLWISQSTHTGSVAGGRLSLTARLVS